MKTSKYAAAAVCGLIASACAADRSIAAVVNGERVDPGPEINGQFYIGINLGISQFGSADVRDSDVTTEWHNSENSAWSITAGGRVNRYFGIEASYFDLGAPELSTSQTVVRGPARAFQFDQYKLDTSAFAITIVGTTQTGNTQFDGRLGLLMSKTDGHGSSRIESSFAGGGPPTVTVYEIDDSDSAVGVQVGLGAGYTFAEHYHVRADFMLLAPVGDSTSLGEFPILMTTVGFQYRF